MPLRKIAATVAEHLLWVVIITLTLIGIVIREKDVTELEGNINDIRERVVEIEKEVKTNH